MVSLPKLSVLKQSGRLLGYDLPGYYEVYRLKKKNYMVVDGIKDGKYYQYVALFKKRIGVLINGLNALTGELL